MEVQIDPHDLQSGSPVCIMKIIHIIFFLTDNLLLYDKLVCVAHVILNYYKQMIIDFKQSCK